MCGLGFPHTRGRVVLLVLVVPLVFRASEGPAVGPGCFVCPWAAARRISGVAMPRQISGRRVACPPARRPRCELRSARRLEARPGPAGPAAASNRAGLGARVLTLALPPPTGTAARPGRPRGGLRAYTGRCLAISHVIPLRMFLVLKWDRWYSAVFELLVNEVLGELRATFRGAQCGARQFRMQFPPSILLVCIASYC